jgi:outer membrane protein assembly factor BamB
MNDSHDNGLESIWPRVSAEIESERRKTVRRRKLLRRSATGLGAMAAAGLVWAVVAGNRPPAAADSWQLADVSLSADNRNEYPLVRGQRVFAMRHRDGAQHVVCIGKLTGGILWENALPFRECRLVADERRVYVLGRGDSAEWQCSALDAANGKLLWSCADELSATQPPLTFTVLRAGVCLTRQGTLVLRNGETGELKWRAKFAANEVVSAPVEHGREVFTASRSRLYALDSNTGERLWSRALEENSVVFTPLPPLLRVSADRLVVAFRRAITGGVLQCVDPGTREILWARETSAPINLDADAEHVYLRSQTLAAYDARTGGPLWTANVGGCGPLAFDDGRVYLADPKSRYSLLALDARMGKPVWRRSAVASCGGIVVSEKIGFVSGADGRLRAVVLGG